MDKCEKCGMRIDDQSKCSCGPNVCYHCCACKPGCKCGCKEKEAEEKAE